MSTVVINLPTLTEADDFEVKMMVAGGLYERGKLSAGQAAEIVGLSKRAFIEVMGKFGFSVIGYTAEEVLEDVKRFEAWSK